MLKKTFTLDTANVITYPIFRNWSDLDASQREACEAQGYEAESNSFFWFDKDGNAYCWEDDIKVLDGVFHCFADWGYYVVTPTTTFLAKIHYSDDGMAAFLTLAEITND